MIALAVVLILGGLAIFNLVGFLLWLVMAGLIGAIANAFVPYKIPHGALGLILVGLIGGWLGPLVFGHWGPHLFGFWLVPAFAGALILTFVMSWAAGSRARGYR